MNWETNLAQPIYFLSDTHLFQEDTASERIRRAALFSLFEEIAHQNATLIIAGDFFDFWFGWKSVVAAEYVDVLHELEKLYRSGTDIHLLTGNHDYWNLDYFKKKCNAEIHLGNLEFRADGQRVLVTHGDGILKYDGAYRAMRKLIRNKFFMNAFYMLHPDLATRIGKYVSSTRVDRQLPQKKEMAIYKEILEWSIQQWKNGIDVVAMGHYHQVGITEKSGNKKLLLLGDWLTNRTVTRYSNGSWEQFNWKKTN